VTRAEGPGRAFRPNAGIRGRLAPTAHQGQAWIHGAKPDQGIVTSWGSRTRKSRTAVDASDDLECRWVELGRSYRFGHRPARPVAARLRSVSIPLVFLTDAQVAACGRFDGVPSRADLERFFLDDADKELIGDRRGDHNRLGVMLQVMTVRYLGVFLEDPLDVPWPVVQYLAEQLGTADPSCIKRYTERAKTAYEPAWEIRKAYGFRVLEDEQLVADFCWPWSLGSSWRRWMPPARAPWMSRWRGRRREDRPREQIAGALAIHVDDLDLNLDDEHVRLTGKGGRYAPFCWTTRPWWRCCAAASRPAATPTARSFVPRRTTAAGHCATPRSGSSGPSTARWSTSP
jgi:Domain of unknown function (DUF4158)